MGGAGDNEDGGKMTGEGYRLVTLSFWERKKILDTEQAAFRLD